jgi:hypothetical protein
MTTPVKRKPALAKTAAYLNTRPMRKAQGIGTASRGKQPDMAATAPRVGGLQVTEGVSASPRPRRRLRRSRS